MLTFWSLHENLTGDIQVDFQLKRAKNENGSNNKIIKKVSFEKLIFNSRYRTSDHANKPVAEPVWLNSSYLLIGNA